MVSLANFDINKHDLSLVARFLFEADPEFAIVGFGNEIDAIGFFSYMIKNKKKPFIAPFLQVIQKDEKIVGAILGFPVSKAMSSSIGYGFGLFGYFKFFKSLKRISGLICLGRVCSGHMNRDGFYLMYLCVEKSLRGQGIGSIIISDLLSNNSKIYLHVNLHKKDTVGFYQSKGFVTKHEATAKYKGNLLQARLMEKRKT
jgi:ribosomal protein S18 acetylase RimI-like enzyme